MTSPQRLETVRRIRTTMAFSYMSMGSWCLLHPSSVIALSLTPQYAIINRTTCLIMRCFGAQAMTAGLLMGSLPAETASRSVFRNFGLAMVPYLAFNFWFIAGPGRGVFTDWLVLDLVGNVVFALGSAWCVRLLGEEEEEQQQRERKVKGN